jgi:hypothetical protein
MLTLLPFALDHWLLSAALDALTLMPELLLGPKVGH